MKRASVSDVSRRAGVSTATVSRVLNDPEKVSEVTRAKVLAAIEELSFVKSAAAFSLKARQSHNVLVVVSKIGNIFYSKMFQGVQRRAEENGYSVIITSRADEMHHPVLERLRTGRVDGVLVLDATPLGPADLDFLKSFYRQTPPIVGFSEKAGILPYPHVLVDNFRPSYELTRHLIDLGHRDIGVVQAPENLPVRLERLGGFMQAMRDAGLAVPDRNVFKGGFESPAGHEVARTLLERGLGDMPTAMVCSNDEMAMGMISDLVKAGIRVPDDLSVIGFDDCTLADVYSPPLTTVAQPRERIGEEAMDLLLRVLADPTIPADTVVVLDTHACIRGTTAPPRKTA
ncbi:MAG: LacI family transcriptional regulator [Alphaproteobacteria bacterium]|nr:LacI family transcriptional regulator [Alphaproteobacteria bacterium]